MTTAHYTVIDASYADEPELADEWRISAEPVSHEVWATDEFDAAAQWADAHWDTQDRPETMVAIVTHSDGRRWRVRMRVEFEPIFNGYAEALSAVEGA